MTEHFIRHGDYLTDAVIVSDPVYLTEPASSAPPKLGSPIRASEDRETYTDANPSWRSIGRWARCLIILPGYQSVPEGIPSALQRSRSIATLAGRGRNHVSRVSSEDRRHRSGSEIVCSWVDQQGLVQMGVSMQVKVRMQAFTVRFPKRMPVALAIAVVRAGCWRWPRSARGMPGRSRIWQNFDKRPRFTSCRCRAANRVHAGGRGRKHHGAGRERRRADRWIRRSPVWLPKLRRPSRPSARSPCATSSTPTTMPITPAAMKRSRRPDRSSRAAISPAPPPTSAMRPPSSRTRTSSSAWKRRRRPSFPRT